MSTINTINNDNTEYHCTCGSGKKYKNCCGR
ncbi:MAG: SEC-C domain-containing protein [Bacilli bacterium]|nr:SEC-C domain-containing protein [Bacilli bacterium]